MSIPENVKTYFHEVLEQTFDAFNMGDKL